LLREVETFMKVVVEEMWSATVYPVRRERLTSWKSHTEATVSPTDGFIIENHKNFPTPT
jgi:hypothetical protein